MRMPRARNPVTRAVRRVYWSALRSSPDRYCRSSLSRDPVPLYSEPARLAVLHNAKAGCTFAAKWFFCQEGTLDEALRYSDWPHHYRQQVVYERPGYLESLSAIPELGPRVIKFVRNPFDRTVSAYLHFARLSRAAAVPVEALPVLRAIGDHANLDVADGAPFTFRDYVDYLASVDLAEANPHLRIQVSRCERVGRLSDMQIIKIEQSRTEVPKVEAALGLKTCDYDALRRSPHHANHAELPGFFGDTPFGDDPGRPVPATTAFYDDQLTRQVSLLYAEDFRQYDYESGSLTTDHSLTSRPASEGASTS